MRFLSTKRSIRGAAKRKHSAQRQSADALSRAAGISPHPSLFSRVTDEARLARREIREGRFQRSMAVLAAFSAIVSGFEAYVQHTRGAFSNKLMWTPVALMPPMVLAAGVAFISERAARLLLPLASLASLIDGVVGFALHLRGIMRMPGGFRVGQYNVVMGPPIFAPLLMTLVGILGLLSAALRPEKKGDWRLPRTPPEGATRPALAGSARENSGVSVPSAPLRGSSTSLRGIEERRLEIGDWRLRAASRCRIFNP